MPSSRLLDNPPQNTLLEIPQELNARPFLKWAGGKTRLLPALRRYVPERFGTYFEPFLGGAAFFFDTAPHSAVLSDSNPELIGSYEVVRDAPAMLVEELANLTVSESEYYRIRALQPEAMPPIARAARFIYLNKTCYNGLYRVNRQGRFNTPFGKYDRVTFAAPENLLAASSLLHSAKLVCGDYASVVEQARQGDFVYFDPPYLPISKYSDFKRYTRDSFYEKDHEALAATFTSLAERGCHVLLSNSLHDTIAKLYSAFHQEVVSVPRFVNCKGEGRGHVSELLISTDLPRDY